MKSKINLSSPSFLHGGSIFNSWRDLLTWDCNCTTSAAVPLLTKCSICDMVSSYLVNCAWYAVLLTESFSSAALPLSSTSEVSFCSNCWSFPIIDWVVFLIFSTVALVQFSISFISSLRYVWVLPALLAKSNWIMMFSLAAFAVNSKCSTLWPTWSTMTQVWQTGKISALVARGVPSSRKPVV